MLNSDEKSQIYIRGGRIVRDTSKTFRLWITCLFLCMAICFDIIAFVTPDKEFSETENRMLAQLPKITGKNLSDGSFCENTEKYLSDQFAYRDAWSSISFFIRHSVFRQSEINGVYTGKDNYLMLIPSAPRGLEQKLDSINAVTQRYHELNHCMAVIPNAVTVMTDKLPLFVPPSRQPEQLSATADALQGIHFCDVTRWLQSHSDEDLYYHTDHHWTSRGAYLSFRSIASSLQIDPDSVSFDIYTVSEDFQGTLASKCGSHGFHDKIEIYVPKGNMPLSVKYSDSSETKGTVYQKEYLDTKDKYALFLGGNHPIVTVTTTADTDRSLLLIKDSYANCFVQFLTPYFDQIIIVDPRYCYDSIDAVINQYRITDLLYLYNADTFMTDTSLSDFLMLEPQPTAE